MGASPVPQRVTTFPAVQIVNLIALAVRRETDVQRPVSAMAMLDLCIEELAPMSIGLQPSVRRVVKMVRASLLNQPDSPVCSYRQLPVRSTDDDKWLWTPLATSSLVQS